jgi:putative addiction module killer protein
MVVKNLHIFTTSDGKQPYIQWLESLRDTKTRLRILERVERLSLGLYGDCKPVGDGVLELRFFFGSGYRVYIAEEGADIIVLLSGGDKDSQPKDIKQAKKYWQQYKDDKL